MRLVNGKSRGRFACGAALGTFAPATPGLFVERGEAALRRRLPTRFTGAYGPN
jgi:hypothetical protein